MRAIGALTVGGGFGVTVAMVGHLGIGLPAWLAVFFGVVVMLVTVRFLAPEWLK